MAKTHSRYCLVTVGATVGFEELTATALQPSFWYFLQSQGFTHLRIQCGPEAPAAQKKLNLLEDEVLDALEITVFDVRKNLMKEEMMYCKKMEDSRSLGLVISHAGTGTILDAWKLGLPLIVVPNTRLLHDHQKEMAAHLSNEGYATMASANLEDLQEAIHKSELLWKENQCRWPANHVQTDSDEGIGFWGLPTLGKELGREVDAQMSND